MDKTAYRPRSTSLIPETCPECAAHIPIPIGTVKGEIFHCPDCRAELEVVRADYIFLLDLAPPVEEDWGE